MPKKLNAAAPSTTQSVHAIALLTQLSDVLKRQQRHFDEAVVTHSIELVTDYVESGLQDLTAQEPQKPSDSDVN
jgi:hypothetical protein